MQKILKENGINDLFSTLKIIGTKKYLLACDTSFPYLRVKNRLSDIGVPYVKFDGFASVPEE